MPRSLLQRIKDSTPVDGKVYPCPVCGIESIYARSLDRFVHDDGSANRRCWAAIMAGEVDVDAMLAGTKPWRAPRRSASKK
jgi:hypothetical protein